jgi:hypothetical protein
VTSDVTGDLPAAGGAAHQRDVVEIERLDHGREIVGVAVHVVPRRGLARSAMAAPVVRDRAQAVLREEQHLATVAVVIVRSGSSRRL